MSDDARMNAPHESPLEASVHDESSQRGAKRIAISLAVLLALVAVGAAVRAVMMGAGEGRLSLTELSKTSHYPAARIEPARVLVEQLAGGLLACQTTDGGFRPEAKLSSTFGHSLDRLAATALAAVSLEAAKAYCHADRQAEIDRSVASAIAFLKKHQQDHGAIGRYVETRRWSQVEATVGGVLALALADGNEHHDALKRAAKALVPMARQGLRNGWPRGLNAMAIEWIVRRELGDIFGVPARELVEARRVTKMPKDAGTSYRDQNMAEAISRTVLGVDRGVGAFPRQMADVLIEEKPSWNGQATSLPTWWMEAWLVARLGREGASAWFDAMADALIEWVDKDDLIPGGWDAPPLMQTATAILALREGFARGDAAR